MPSLVTPSTPQAKPVSFNVFQQEADKNNLAKALTMAQIQRQRAAATKAARPDFEELGKAAFFKAAQGQPLTNEETAAARLFDSMKGGGLAYDPITGQAIQKPRISDSIPIGTTFEQPQIETPQQNYIQPVQSGQDMSPSEQSAAMVDLYGEQSAPQEIDPLEKSYEEEMVRAGNNRKRRQEIDSFYSKKRFEKKERLATETKNKTKFNKGLVAILDNFEKLKALNAVVSTKAPMADSLANSMWASTVGQAAQSMVGTQEQTIRDGLRSQERTLMQAFKKSAGMTGTELNSNVELKNTLAALINPKTPYESAYQIAANLDNEFGLGEIEPRSAEGGRTIRGGVAEARGINAGEERSKALSALQRVRSPSGKEKVRQRFYERTGERLD